MLCIDMIYAERDSLLNGQMVAYSRDQDQNLNNHLELNDLLFQYGARINSDLVVDQHCDVIPVEVGSIGGKPQTQLLPWPFFPLLQSGSNHPLVKNQADVLSSYANSIDTAEQVPQIRKTVLLQTSDVSARRKTPTIIDINLLKEKADLRSYNQKYIPVAMLLEGKFKSAFAHRASVAQKDSFNHYGQPFLTTAQTEGKLILIADADIVVNAVTQTYGPLPMGTNNYTRVGYANHDFFMNCVEYLSNRDNVLESRAKDYTLRLLDPKKVEQSKFFWQVFNILLPAIVVICFAVVLQWNRKRKFAY
jgi:gliding-associated putative ABC transporter substrate-binding component GldG